MAKFTKRIKKNIAAPRLEAEEEARDLAAEEPKQYRPWETYVIVGIMTMTIFLVAGSWELLDGTKRIMYVLLLITMGLMYMQRRMTTLSQSQSLWLGRAVITLLISSVLIFLYETFFPAAA